jgi:uncharacterized protein (TIRG00374 family)
MARKSLWLGMLLTLVFLALAFRGVDPAALTRALAQANYWLVIPPVLATATGYLVRAARWRVILASRRPLRFPRVLSVLVIGFAANNVLPARLGELVRAMLLQRHGGERAASGLATIFVERVADGLTLLLVLVVLTAADLIPGVPNQFDNLELLTAAVFLGLATCIGLALAREQLACRLVELLVRPLPRRLALLATSIARGILDGLAGMRRPERLALTALLSLLVWLLEGLSYFGLAAAFNLPLDITQRAVLAGTVLVLVNLSIMIPSAPGYVGTFDFVAKGALVLFGIPPETALAYAIVSHALQYVLVTGAGLVFLAREGLTLRTLLGAPLEPRTAAPLVPLEEPVEQVVP